MLLSGTQPAVAQTSDSSDTATLGQPSGYPSILKDNPHMVVVQDDAVLRLMQEKIAGIVHGTVEMPGFRVQVYSSNRQAVAKAEALKVKERIEGSVSLPVYVISAPPFIKVRVGDFRTQQDAADCKQELIQLFPDLVGDTYVVRDEHIIVKQ